jgi:uncharacterized protein YdaL
MTRHLLQRLGFEWRQERAQVRARTGDQMTCTLSLRWSLVFLPALVGCMTNGPAAREQAKAPPAATTTAPDNAGEAAKPIPVSIIDQPQHDNINVRNEFPAFFGDAPLIDSAHRLVPQERGQDKRPATTQTAFLSAAAGTLVLYDTTGAYGWLGELHAIAAKNLASHFGITATKPVAQYQTGDMAPYKAVIYVGSTYNEPLPVAFLDDVLAGGTQVLWLYDNIWQLANRSATFVATYGFNPWAFDISPIASVTYHGITLTRDPLNASGLMQFNTLDTAKVTVLGTANRADGSTLPWAIRSGSLTYVCEMPFGYLDFNDRYLAFCDLLFDLLAPTAPTKHQALVRLEDVNPITDPVAFHAMVDYLYNANVPFAVATIPIFLDTHGLFNNGKPLALRWIDRPNMLTELKYATTHGGTLIMHGYTHQLGNQRNPYDGISADDFEFFVTHVDSVTNNVIYDGPVPGDSASWAIGRINAGLAAFQSAGLAAPTVFEYPHYAGSAVDSKAIQTIMPGAYHRGMYFAGDLGAPNPDPNHRLGQFFPYTVTDVYGFNVIPECLGNYEPEPFNNHPARLAADLVFTAQNNLVIRNGVASFFFHPYYPLKELQAIVEGVKKAGYKFVSIGSL